MHTRWAVRPTPAAEKLMALCRSSRSLSLSLSLGCLPAKPDVAEFNWICECARVRTPHGQELSVRDKRPAMRCVCTAADCWRFMASEAKRGQIRFGVEVKPSRVLGAKAARRLTRAYACASVLMKAHHCQNKPRF